MPDIYTLIDRTSTRIAVGANDVNGVRLHTLVAGEISWDGTIPTPALIVAGVTGTGGGGSSITGTVIAVPSDFNSTSLFTCNVYVGVSTSGVASATDNVWRQGVGSVNDAVILNPLATYAAFGVTDQSVTSLAYSGTENAGTLYAGSEALGAPVVISTAGAPAATTAVPPTWYGAVASPTGTGITYVALSTDFATSMKVYVGTRGDDSALSVSEDGGLYYYQAGLIDTTIATITDFATPSATDFFLSTNDGVKTSLWRSLDSGANWCRILSVTAVGGILRTSPNYATDSTVVFGAVGGTTLKVSNNKGSSWNSLVANSPVQIADIAMKDQYTFYVASGTALTVSTTLNGGYYFSPVPTTIPYSTGSAVTSLKIDIATGTLLAGTNGGSVSYSNDGNTTWLPGITGLFAGNTLVAFDASYATNKNIYAVSSGVAGVYRWVIGTSSYWTNIDSGIVGNTSLAGTVSDILTTPDGSLYISDNTPMNGMHRSNNPTYGLCIPGMIGSFPNWNQISTSLEPTFGVTARITLLSWVSGSNIIYAVDNNLIFGYQVQIYNDTLTTVEPTPTSPTNGDTITSATVRFEWNSIPGAIFYEVQYDIRADWASATTVMTAFAFDSNTSVILQNKAKYYWRVRARIPLYSQWSQTQTFTLVDDITATTVPYTNLTATSVTLHGYLANWNASSVNLSFVWGDESQVDPKQYPYETTAVPATLTQSGTFAVDLTGLTPNKAYFYRAKAVGNGTAYGIEGRFVTLSFDTVVTVEVNSGNTISLTQNGTRSDIPLTINEIPAAGMGAFQIDLSWNKDVIHVDSVTAGSVSDFSIIPGDPDNGTGTVSITGFSGTGYVGDATIATINIGAVGNPGDSTFIDITITTFVDEDGLDIPASPVAALVQIVNLMAETGISLEKDSNGFIVVSMNVTRIKDPTSGETVDLLAGIDSFIISADVMPPDSIQLPGQPVISVFPVYPPDKMASLIATLSGNCTTPCTLTLSLLDIFSGGVPILEEHTNSLNFLRGDANNDGTVNILDAMYIAQYIVKKKTLEQLNALDAASVKHDTGGDKIDILDAMYIAQYIVKKRDAYFNL